MAFMVSLMILEEGLIRYMGYVSVMRGDARRW